MVPPANQVKNLGVILDAEMSMRPRVNQIVKSAYYHLRAISRIQRHLDHKTRVSIVQTLVISRLDYANSILAGLPQTLLRKLQLVQNNAARLVSRTRRREHITPVLRQLHWLPVHKRIAHKILMLVYKSLRSNTAPAYIRDMLEVYEPARTLRSSNAVAPQLNVPRTHRCAGDRAFAVAAPVLWNNLPVKAQQSCSYASFKKAVKTFFFIQCYEQ